MSALALSPGEQVLRAALVKRHVPEQLHGDIVRYIEDGILPGHFLRAAFDNNFVQAMQRADALHLSHADLFNLAMFIYHHAPYMSWGSAGAVLAWHKSFPKIRGIDDGR